MHVLNHVPTCFFEKAFTKLVLSNFSSMVVSGEGKNILIANVTLLRNN